MDDVDGMKKKLYLQVRPRIYCPDFFMRHFDGDGEHKWFFFAADGADGGAVKEIPDLSHEFPRDTASACLNSTIYVCGGKEIRLKYVEGWRYEDPITNDFWRTDTYLDDYGVVCGSSWIKCPSMINRRMLADAVAVDGKVYVFGGIDKPNSSTWAEVFDISLNSWSVMVPPTEDNVTLYVSMCCVVEIDKKQIILVYTPQIGNGSLYSYDLKLKIWELYDSEFGLWPDPLVLSSGGSTNPLLLTMNEGDLYGYDVGRKMWFKDPVSGGVLPPPDRLCYANQFKLVSLGSNWKLFLLWSKRSINNTSNLLVSVTRFTVYEVNGSSLAAKAEYTNDFILHMAEELISCLALAPHPGKKRGGESPYTEEDKKIKHQHP